MNGAESERTPIVASASERLIKGRATGRNGERVIILDEPELTQIKSSIIRRRASRGRGQKKERRNAFKQAGRSMVNQLATIWQGGIASFGCH